MNDIGAVFAGRIEDKWIEFVATEFADRTRRDRATRRQGRDSLRARCVEVHASYVWLLAAAVVTWFVS